MLLLPLAKGAKFEVSCSENWSDNLGIGWNSVHGPPGDKNSNYSVLKELQMILRKIPCSTLCATAMSEFFLLAAGGHVSLLTQSHGAYPKIGWKISETLYCPNPLQHDFQSLKLVQTHCFFPTCFSFPKFSHPTFDP